MIGGCLRQWFEDSDEIQALRAASRRTPSPIASGSVIASCVRNPEGPFEVEQQAYIGERDGRIGWMRSVCSGFRPVEGE